jgi:Arc/MetJ-type ribon-helix-helix transcriptional regulator
LTDPHRPPRVLTVSDKRELTSMTVSLPSAQKDYVREQAEATGCSTPSEYIRRLIHADQRAREQEALELRILEGLDSPSREITAKEWSKLRRSLRSKLTKRRKAR